MVVAVYLLDYLSSRSSKCVHADFFRCAKMIQTDVNIVILGVPDMHSSDGTKLGKTLRFGICERIVSSVIKAWLSSCQCVEQPRQLVRV